MEFPELSHGCYHLDYHFWYITLVGWICSIFKFLLLALVYSLNINCPSQFIAVIECDLGEIFICHFWEKLKEIISMCLNSTNPSPPNVQFITQFSLFPTFRMMSLIFPTMGGYNIFYLSLLTAASGKNNWLLSKSIN